MTFSSFDLVALMLVITFANAVAPMVEALIATLFISLFGPIDGDDEDF